MRLFRHYHYRDLIARVRSDSVKFEFSVWLHSVGRSLIVIFIPILMLRYGYPLQAVLVYYMAFNGLTVPLNFLARRLVQGVGARAVILTSTFFAIVYLALFPRLAGGGWTVLLALAVVNAFYDSFYWVAQVYLFIETSEPTNMEAGRRTGLWTSVRTLGSMLGPAIGAGILLFGSQGALFGVGIIILGLSAIPLFTLQHTRNQPASPGMPFREFFREVREKRDYFLFALYSMSGVVEDILWPIFIFLAFGGLQSIAAVALVVSLSTMAFSYVTGNMTRRSGSRLIVIGSVCAALVWVLRLAIPNGFIYYASIFFMGFFGIMMAIPLDSNIVERAREKDSLDAATMRNVSSMFPQFLLFTLLLVVTSVFKVSFFAAIAALVALLILSRFLSARMRAVPLAVPTGGVGK